MVPDMFYVFYFITSSGERFQSEKNEIILFITKRDKNSHIKTEKSAVRVLKSPM